MRRVPPLRICINYHTQLTHFSAETWSSRTVFEPGVKLEVLATKHSSDGDGDLPLLLKGEVLKSLVETLIVRIPFFCFFSFVVVVFTFVIFVIELPSDERENVVWYEGI